MNGNSVRTPEYSRSMPASRLWTEVGQDSGDNSGTSTTPVRREPTYLWYFSHCAKGPCSRLSCSREELLLWKLILLPLMRDVVLHSIVVRIPLKVEIKIGVLDGRFQLVLVRTTHALAVPAAQDTKMIR